MKSYKGRATLRAPVKGTGARARMLIVALAVTVVVAGTAEAAPLHTTDMTANDVVSLGLEDGIFSDGFEPTQTLLSVSVSNLDGASGSVVSTPAGIECASACEALFDINTTVDLVPMSLSNSVFDGWGGDCDGSGICTVTMDVERSVEAQFSENTQVSDGFPPPPALCGAQSSGRKIPYDIFRDFQSNPPDGNPKVNYEQTFGLWPGGDVSTVIVPLNQYVAMPFRADEAPGKIWRLDWVGGPSNGNATQVNISLCPGDFQGLGYNDAFCSVDSSAEGSTLIAILGESNLACDLVPGEVYYLNVRHQTPDGRNSCFESSRRCGFRAAPSTLN